MKRNKVRLNAFRQAAISLGRLERGDRDISHLPAYEFVQIAESLQRGSKSKRTDSICQESAYLLAHSLLSEKPLSSLSFVCVSKDHGSRHRQQGQQFELTDGERLMLRRACDIRQAGEANGLTISWRLIVADSWALKLYPQYVSPEVVNEYALMMEEACQQVGFEAIRWSHMMESNGLLYDHARQRAVVVLGSDVYRGKMEKEVGARAFMDSGARKDEIMRVTHEHAIMRAAEGVVMINAFGETIVLSTEPKSWCVFDHAIVTPQQYPQVFCAMPFRPGWLD